MRQNSAFSATNWRFWFQGSASIGCLNNKCCFIDENRKLAIDDTLRNMFLSTHEVAFQHQLQDLMEAADKAASGSKKVLSLKQPNGGNTPKNQPPLAYYRE